MKYWCFYNHTTLDGLCSGTIVKYRFPECEMIQVSSKNQQLYDIEEEEGVHEFSSCEQVWKMLFPDRPVPLAVTLLSLYDSGTYHGHELEDMVLPFQMRMRMEELDPKDWTGTCAYLWTFLFNTEKGIWEDRVYQKIIDFVTEGRLLLRYDEKCSWRILTKEVLTSVGISINDIV